MKHWFKDILNFIYPAECHVCGQNLAPNESFVCTNCISNLARTGYHRSPQNPVEQRFAGRFPFVAATSHFFYSRDSSLALLIQDMKYRGFSHIGDLLGEIAGKELFPTGFLNDVDLIVPVPMHFWKKAKRGYNQTDHIAAGISKATGIPVADVLRMTRRRKSQTALSLSQRLSNARNLFAVRKGQDLKDKSVLVVDDVCTTGTTVGAACKALTDVFPDCKIYIFTLGATI